MVNSSDSEQEEEMNNPAAAGIPRSFNERWDLTSKHAIQSTNSEIQASQVVLEALRLRRGSETAKWLNTLESEISLPNQSPSNSQPGITATTLLQPSPILVQETQILDEQAMIDKAIRGLDKLFDEFDLYASQFNRTAQGTDLLVSCTRPIKNNDTNGTCLSYAGNLSTRLWAMVVRGCASKIEVFVIPAELLLAFSIHKMDEAGYKPLLVVEAEWRDGKPIWHIEKTTITQTQVPMLAKELFGDLIRVASGQMSEAELFAHPLQEFALGKNLAVGYQTKSANPANANITIATPPNLSVSPINMVPASPAPVSVNTNPNPAVPKAPISLPSINAAEQLLVIVNKDINQLLELGKTVLQSEDATNFEKIKIMTDKMEALKIAVSTSLENVRKAAE